jgi:hypothetical protein
LPVYKQSESRQLLSQCGARNPGVSPQGRTQQNFGSTCRLRRAGLGCGRSGRGSSGGRRVSRPERSGVPDAARRQRPAGQKTKSCMCPCGPRGAWAAAERGVVRAGDPPNLGPVWGGAFVPQALAGKLWRRYLCEVPCWCVGRWRARRQGGPAAEASGWGLEGGWLVGLGLVSPFLVAQEPASGRSGSPLKSNCCHV